MIKAIEDKIIVSEMKRSKRKAGILIPSSAVEPQAYGRVVSLGHEVVNRGQLEVGDVIVYHKMGGQAISMDNRILCCVPYAEIYGTLTDEDMLAELEEIEVTPVEDVPAPETSPLIHQV